MKKILIFVLSIILLLLPIIVITGLYFIFEINAFIEPDFWYGYMAYFGTVTLAAVSLWQNKVFKDENDKSQDRLEKIHKQANEIDTINKILEFEHTRIHNLYKYLDEFEKACHHNNITIALHGCANEKIVITQAIEKCDFLFLAVTRELRVDMRGDKLKDEIFELCSKMYNTFVELCKAHENRKSDVEKFEAELSGIWKQYFTTKEKYINSVQKDFQKLLYGNLTLEEIRNIYYKNKPEEDKDGQTENAQPEQG